MSERVCGEAEEEEEQDVEDALYFYVADCFFSLISFRYPPQRPTVKPVRYSGGKVSIHPQTSSVKRLLSNEVFRVVSHHAVLQFSLLSRILFPCSVKKN